MRKLLFLLVILIAFITPAKAQSGLFVRPDGSSILSPVTNGTWLFNSTTGQLNVWNGSTYASLSPPFSNFGATTDPTTADDDTEGYQIGSLWLNTVDSTYFLCTDPTTSAAVWQLVITNTNPGSTIPLLLKTSLSTNDFASSTLVPAVPGSGLVATLPAGQAYVNGSIVSVSSGSHTYTATKWTYDFVTNTGTISHHEQAVNTLPPTVANAVLAYLVITDATDITAVTPYFAVPPVLRNYMITPPGSSGLVFQTDTTNPLGLTYGPVLLASLDTTGASSGNSMLFSGGVWGAGTLGPTGGGTGISSTPTDGQLFIGQTSGSGYVLGTLTAGTNIAVTNGSGTITIATNLVSPGAIGGTTPSTGAFTNLSAKHLIGTSATPTKTLQSGAGSGASATITGTDLAGSVSVTTGAAPVLSADIIDVNFAASYGSAPYVVLTPAEPNAAALSGASGIYVTSGTSSFSLNSGTSALVTLTTYTWNYMVCQ